MKTITFIVLLLLSIHLMGASSVDIIKGTSFMSVETAEKTYKIQRTQKEGDSLTNTFALTSRPSPPFFIEPFTVSNKVETYGELEVLAFIAKKRGIFIDARLENWHKKSAIPSALNIPFKMFLSKSIQRNEILKSFGATYKKGKWDFRKAKKLLFYCNGAWCGQSPTAINALIDIGYPQKKMKYYRGGMQAWQLLGLTTIKPEEIK